MQKILNQAFSELRISLLLSLLVHLAALGLILTYAPRISFEALRGRVGGSGLFFLVGNPAGGASGGDLETHHATRPKPRPKNAIATSESHETIATTELKNETTSGNGQAQKGGSGGETLAAGGNGLSGINGAGGGNGTIEDQRLRLIRNKIEGAKNYPFVALHQGVQGIVRVRFKINEQGYPEDASVIESSGSAILDHATLATLKRAAPYPTVPGWITFPLRYDLAKN